MSGGGEARCYGTSNLSQCSRIGRDVPSQLSGEGGRDGERGGRVREREGGREKEGGGRGVSE